MNSSMLTTAGWGLQSRRLLPGVAPRSRAPLRAPRVGSVVVRAQQEGDKKKVEALEESMKAAGLDKEKAQQVLKAWRDAAGGGDGKEVTAEDLRKVLVKQGSRFSALIGVQILFDLGAAYGAFLAGNFMGSAAADGDYGVPAIVLSSVAYILAGWYASGAVFDVFKLGAVLVATYQFNVDSAAFLAAVQDVAGPGAATGLGTVDKAVEAVNTVKVISGLNKMAALLKEQKPTGNGSDMLKDLAAYLTLEKAQRVYGFNASQYGIDDQEAAEIATVFTAFDADDNGLLSLDEFQRLCARYAPELNEAEVRQGMALLDTNADGSIQLGEFVAWWLQRPSTA